MVRWNTSRAGLHRSRGLRAVRDHQRYYGQGCQWLSGSCKAFAKWHTLRHQISIKTIDQIDVCREWRVNSWIGSPVALLSNKLSKHFSYHRVLRDWGGIPYRHRIHTRGQPFQRHVDEIAKWTDIWAHSKKCAQTNCHRLTWLQIAPNHPPRYKTR